MAADNSPLIRVCHLFFQQRVMTWDWEETSESLSQGQSSETTGIYKPVAGSSSPEVILISVNCY